MKWENLFKSHILDRGYEYFTNGQVQNVCRDGDVITAEVEGSCDYDVEIHLHNGEVKDMYCDCPYADGGDCCKHMAAVLYEVYENDEANETVKSFEDEIHSAVFSADEKAVRNFLYDILKNDERLWLKFKNSVSPGHNTTDLKFLMGQVDELVYAYSDRHGYINYNVAYDLCLDVDEFVNENSESLVDSKRFEDAFELALYILKMMDGLNIDDSDGGCTMVADSCSEQLDTIISMADISIKRRFYEIVKAEVLKDSFDCLGEYLVDILTKSFVDDEFIAENLEFADSMLKKYEAKTNDFSAEYNAVRWFNKYLFLMETAGRSDEERLAYCKNHWQLENAKDEAIKIYCEQGNYAKEAEVLKEYIAIEDKGWTRTVGYKQRLKEIYSITGDKENYIEMLWSLVTKSPTIELYNELKSCYTAEEWQEMREKVFSEIKNKYYLAEFYVAEKLYDRLLDYVLSSDGFDSADKYSAVLGKLYPNEILEKYRVEIEKVAVHTMGRGAYRGWVQILKKMRKINGGNEVVEEIARHWRMTYSNRRAMMEELDKLKK